MAEVYIFVNSLCSCFHIIYPFYVGRSEAGRMGKGSEATISAWGKKQSLLPNAYGTLVHILTPQSL